MIPRKCLKVYVAGKTQDLRNVQDLQHTVKRCGHTITHDWTQIVESNGGDINEVHVPKELRVQYARADMLGVLYADLVIAVGHPNLCGTLWECGMAVVMNKPLVLYKWDRVSRTSIFEGLPTVSYIGHDFALMDLLENPERVIPRELNVGL